jgi:hypothetical protein
MRSGLSHHKLRATSMTASRAGVQSLDRLAALMGRQFERSPEPDAAHFGRSRPTIPVRQRGELACVNRLTHAARKAAHIVSLDLQINSVFWITTDLPNSF